MPATTITREVFEKATTNFVDLQAERDLKIQAGAIRSDIDQTSDPANYILITEWNVLGQNDASGAQPTDRLTAAKQAFDFFVSTGWSKEQAAGLIANIEAESSFRLNAVGDGGLAYGLCQWHPDRQENFKAQFGQDIRSASFAQQLEFVNFELLNGNERAAGRALAQATTPQDAGSTVCARYERPRDPLGQVAAQRGSRAVDWFNRLA